MMSLPASHADRMTRTGIGFALTQHGHFPASPSLRNWLSRLPLHLPALLLPVVAMAAMSLLQRASVSAVAALSGRRLDTRLVFGGFLTRDFPKTAGGYWLWEKALSRNAGGEMEDSSRVTLVESGESWEKLGTWDLRDGAWAM